MSKHTPGPWKVVDLYGRAQIYSEPREDEFEGSASYGKNTLHLG